MTTTELPRVEFRDLGGGRFCSESHFGEQVTTVTFTLDGQSTENPGWLYFENQVVFAFITNLIKMCKYSVNNQIMKPINRIGF